MAKRQKKVTWKVVPAPGVSTMRKNKSRLKARRSRINRNGATTTFTKTREPLRHRAYSPSSVPSSSLNERLKDGSGGMFFTLCNFIEEQKYIGDARIEPKFPYLLGCDYSFQMGWSKDLRRSNHKQWGSDPFDYSRGTMAIYMGTVRVDEEKYSSKLKTINVVSLKRHSFLIDGKMYLIQDINLFKHIDDYSPEEDDIENEKSPSFGSE